MSCGIYQILNTVTEKCYVGSSVDIKDRWDHHRMDLIGNRHANGRLQNAWNKYGPEVWTWNILQECEKEKLDLLEAFWIGSLNSNKNGYNIAVLLLEDGKVLRKHSPETIAKMKKSHNISKEGLRRMSEANKGKTILPENIEKIRQANLGRRMGDDHRRIISEYHKGKPKSEEQKVKMRESRNNLPEEVKQKIRNSRIGKSHTLEARKKMSESNKGKKVSPETIAKMTAANKGRHLTEEHKRKVGEAGKGQKRSEETKAKIRDAIRLSWENYTPEQRAARAKLYERKTV